MTDQQTRLLIAANNQNNQAKGNCESRKRHEENDEKEKTFIAKKSQKRTNTTEHTKPNQQKETAIHERSEARPWRRRKRAIAPLDLVAASEEWSSG